MTINLEIRKNPEYEKLVPKLLPAEKEALRKSMKENGQYYHGKVNEKGEILDGHHRFDICGEEGWEFEYETMTFGDKLKEREFVLDVNAKRRQLNEYGKALIAYEYEKIEKEKARLRQLSTIPQKGEKGFQSQSMWGSNEPHTDIEVSNGKSTEIAAKKAGCKSTTTYKRCRKIIESAPEDVKELLLRGNLEIYPVYNHIIDDERREKRRNEIRLNSDTRSYLKNKKYQLIPGNIREVASQILHNTVECIVTDPPYGYEALPLYEFLACLAERVLKPGRSLIFIYGHITLVEIVQIFAKHPGLKYWWHDALIHNGPHKPIDARGIYAGYKPILEYIKGDKPDRISRRNYILDTIQSSKPDKSKDEWAQRPEDVEQFIKDLTLENETVLDPFCGTGTFGIAAIRNNRYFIGIDNNPNKVRIAGDILSKEVKKLEKDKSNETI